MSDSTNVAVLQKLVNNLTELIELDKRKMLNQMKLRWDFTRQLHLAMPKFWLEGQTPIQLVASMHAYYVEYEKIFEKPRPQSCVV